MSVMIEIEATAEIISAEIKVKSVYIINTVNLLKDGCTVPFISRYRKEMTGNMDEKQVLHISRRYKEIESLEERKDYIIGVIESLGKMTDELKKSIIDCSDSDMLEDIYLPYKPKKKTRASIAREKGLAELAEIILYSAGKEDKSEILKSFINPEKQVNSADEALSGALDIIAEIISENSGIRKTVREEITSKGIISAKVKKDYKDKRTKYEQYYSFSSAISKEPPHRILALRRGENEGVLSISVDAENEEIFLGKIKNEYTKKQNIFADEIGKAALDSLKRLILPSVSNEVLRKYIEKSEKFSISIFAENLENLLLSPYAGGKTILGIDPGFRSGCKLAVISKTNEFLGYDVIYPHEPQKKEAEAKAAVKKIIDKYSVEFISIGNGTAGRETEDFIKDFVSKEIPVVMVSESGASVYSASETARREFPDLDLTVRSAVNIARRFQDPLSELVKIDPCAIGVGQYQHDVDQKELKEALKDSVELCVNKVGVDVNTASVEILSYVSGVGSSLAAKIVKKRNELKGFKSRMDIKKVSGLGEKAFEQCAAFLRIKDAPNPLDSSAIHPESYSIVMKMAEDAGVNLNDLIASPDLISRIDKKKYSSAGAYTLDDILKELSKPGRDPRKQYSYADFNSSVRTLDDLSEGMILSGVVTNVTAFGAFVDIGVHQDGLIHISNLSDKFISNISEAVKVGETLMTEVISVDKELKRISLRRKTDG